jgi:hypothetical protein
MEGIGGDKVASLADVRSQKRWETAQSPNDHKPEDALRAALRDIEEFQPEHVVIVFGKISKEGDPETDGDLGVGITRFYQSGSYNVYAQDGLLNAARMLMV